MDVATCAYVHTDVERQGVQSLGRIFPMKVAWGMNALVRVRSDRWTCRSVEGGSGSGSGFERKSTRMATIDDGE